MVSVCRAVCAEEQSLLLDPVMSSDYFVFMFSSLVFFVYFSSICLFLLTELNEVLDRLTLVQSQPVGSGRVETTDTSGDETGGRKRPSN